MNVLWIDGTLALAALASPVVALLTIALLNARLRRGCAMTTAAKKTARLIRKLDGTWTGDARLYELSEPLVDTDWEGVAKAVHSHVIVIVFVSGTVTMFLGLETYIFPATAEGEIVDWGELDGSFRGAINHDEALQNAGYEVTA